MKKIEIQGLYTILEKRLVGIAIAQGLVILRPGAKKYSFSNCKITLKGVSEIRELSDISEENLELFRDQFPQGLRSSPSVILPKLQRFMLENPEVSFEKIVDAAKYWVEEKADFCGKACNFIYKKEQTGGESSRLTEALDNIKENNNNSFYTDINSLGK